MKPFYLPFIAIAAVALTACGPKETAEKPETHEEEHEENIVALSKENLEHVEIKTEPVAKGRIEATLKVAGRVSKNMNKTAKVATTLEGRLLKLNFDINDPVKAGDVMALVQTPEMPGRPLEIKAPIDGIVMERGSAVGELVDKGGAIYTISDPSDLWIIAEVKERDMAAVKAGQDATFRVLAFPGEEFRGKVARLGNQLESDTRTLEVRIETANPGGRLKSGMFADVEIATTMLEGALVISDTALQSDGEEPVVFVALGDDKFEKRPVTLGLEQRGRAQVLDGLEAGERVVTAGSFILKSELLKSDLGEHSH